MSGQLNGSYRRQVIVIKTQVTTPIFYFYHFIHQTKHCRSCVTNTLRNAKFKKTSFGKCQASFESMFLLYQIIKKIIDYINSETIRPDFALCHFQIQQKSQKIKIPLYQALYRIVKNLLFGRVRLHNSYPNNPISFKELC